MTARLALVQEYFPRTLDPVLDKKVSNSNILPGIDKTDINTAKFVLEYAGCFL